MFRQLSIHRVLLAVPVIAIATATLGFGSGFFGQTQIPSTLADFVQPGTQPNTINSPIFESQDCSGCHGYFNFESEPYRRWVSSMMGQAGRDPMFYACMTVANQDVADVGEMCMRCHMPGAWLDGRSTPTDGSALDPEQGDLDGVTCHFCHRMVDPVLDAENPASDAGILAELTAVNPEPHTGQYVIDPDDVRRGPFDLGPGFFWHQFAESPFHQESKMCGTCHDVSNPLYERVGDDYVLGTLGQQHPTHDKADEFPVERTYSEWANSDYAVRPVASLEFGGNKTEVASCQDCHMPDFSGTACAPALNGEFRDDLPQHNFNGSNTWVLSAIRSLYPDMETKLSQGLVDGALARTQTMMNSATSMDSFVRGGDLVIRIVNQSGHKFPTGYSEGRRAWLHVRFLDGGNNVIEENGAYEFSTATLTTGNTKVYEAEHGPDAAAAAATGVPEAPGFHFAINNKIYKDNRIPPRGFTNSKFVAAQAEPVAYAYSDEQYWDDTVFPIPATAVKAHVFLNHQITSKEYIEFLRDENTTNTLGQVAYDQWELHGKSAPIGIDRAVVDITAATCAEPVEYGLSKETTLDEFPRLMATDMPSVASGSLTLRIERAIPNAKAILISGTDTASANFNGGKRYVSTPFTRVGSIGINEFGVGTFVIPLTPGMEGTRVNYQVVFRDNLSSFGIGLSNGIAVDICD